MRKKPAPKRLRRRIKPQTQDHHIDQDVEASVRAGTYERKQSIGQGGRTRVALVAILSGGPEATASRSAGSRAQLFILPPYPSVDTQNTLLCPLQAHITLCS